MGGIKSGEDTEDQSSCLRLCRVAARQTSSAAGLATVRKGCRNQGKWSADARILKFNETSPLVFLEFFNFFRQGRK